MVFAGLPWQGQRWNRQGEGEMDFVLAHRSRGLLVLEVKGGTLEVVDGKWQQTSRNGHVKELNQSPAEQAADSKRQLQDYLPGKISRVDRLRAGHAVCFPAVSVDGDLALDTPRNIVIDNADLGDPIAAVNRVSGHWDKTTQFDEKQFRELKEALAPTTSLRLKLRDRANQVLEQQLDLTDRQIHAFNFLRGRPRALITGGAGTGKTVLAVGKARELGEAGQRVLLLCFNAPLGENLAGQLDDLDSVTAGNFHKVARRICDRAEMLGDARFDDSDWWSDELPSLLPDAAEAIGEKFDAIIVDEGQDFHANWWTALELLLADPDNGVMYVFADAQQDLYRTGWEAPFDEYPFPLDVNCRNTKQIAARVSGVFGDGIPSLGTEGPQPTFTAINAAAQLPKALGKLIRRLAKEGFAPEDVVVLSSAKKHVDAFRGQQIDEWKLVETGNRGVVVETVQRFKGLEADAVVLILDRVGSAHDRALAYVGLSRPRVVLHVLAPPDAGAAIGWDQ